MSRGFVIALFILALLATAGYSYKAGLDAGYKAGKDYMVSEMLFICAFTHKIEFDNLRFRCGPVAKT